jgi:peptidoglycan hydrolase-like protein with peptidoglycan-binding domain
MHSFFSDFGSTTIKSQVREQIFSLLGNCGKTLFQESGENTLTLHLSLPWYKRFEQIVENIWTTPYKKIIGYSMILFSAVMVSPPDTSFAAETDKTFIVTAYYSPLPDQSFYLKWNYNAERRLNGNWTNGASGAPVFTGMIAAPKSYDFGTNIFFQGLGLWRIEDRGGAIVEAWDRGQPHDRIDIWMWYGEKGLRRALLWWRREVVGTLVTPENAMNMNPIDLEGIDLGRVDLSQYKSVKSSAVGTISEDVISAFEDLGYSVENGDVKAMIMQYQLDHEIIKNREEDGAWTFGPKTRASLASQHGKFQSIQDVELKIIDENKKLLISEHSLWEARTRIIENRISAIGSPKRGDRGDHVVALQWILSKTGFFHGKTTGVMAGPTIIALKKFQKSHGLKPSGQFDTPTKNKFIEESVELW